MKKVMLIVASAILISISGNCQWYYRQYGVRELNQLSQQQLNVSLKKANGGVACGAALSVVGAIGIVGGVVILQDSNNGNADIGRALEGMGLIAISIPLEITGLVIWCINGSRVKSIKETMKNAEIKLGSFNYPTGLVGLSGSTSAGLSVTFHFQ